MKFQKTYIPVVDAVDIGGGVLQVYTQLDIVRPVCPLRLIGITGVGTETDYDDATFSNHKHEQLTAIAVYLSEPAELVFDGVYPCPVTAYDIDIATLPLATAQALILSNSLYVVAYAGEVNLSIHTGQWRDCAFVNVSNPVLVTDVQLEELVDGQAESSTVQTVLPYQHQTIIEEGEPL